MRNLGLDLLRLLAVVLVIGRHLSVPNDAHVGYKAWHQGGWVGVDLFFVLSGFLVSSLLFREYARFGSIDVKKFLIRRGFKIYPAFWLFLGFSLLLRLISGQNPTLTEVLGELLFFQNYLGGVWEHTWSLAVEEHFYLGIAALFTYLIATQPNQPFKWVPAIFVCVAIMCFAFRVLNLFVYPDFSYRTYLFGTHIRVDSLLFGVLIAYLFNFHNLEQRLSGISWPTLLVAGCALLSPAFMFPLETYKGISVIGVAMFYVGSGLFLLAALRLKSTDSDVLKLLGVLGAASYSIYLWHMPVLTWGQQFLHAILGIDNFFIYVVNGVVGSCAVGWFLNRLIEKPALMARDRLFPSSVGAVQRVEQFRSE